MKNRNAGVRLALAAGLTLCALPQAYAAGTTAGASINNTASVDYTVGGVNQPDVLSNTSTFLVDRRINLTVAEVGGAATQVVPGATGQVLTFTVTNLSNAALDFRLSAAQDANGATTAFTDTDNFDVTALQVFVDGKGIGDVGSIVLRDRQHLGMDGVIIVLLGIEKATSKILIGPEIISRGFVYEEESKDILEELKKDSGYIA